MEDTSETVVVTGAAGCLGHATVCALIERDASVGLVRCVDRRAPSPQMERRVRDALASRQQARVEWVRGDVRDINLVERALSGAHCVIHCAAAMRFLGAQHYTTLASIKAAAAAGDAEVQEMSAVNVHATELLLRTCVRLGVRKFVHVSSFEVYTGYNTIYFATENTLPEPDRLLFGASAHTKLAAEQKVREYSNRKLDQVAKCSATTTTSEALNAIIVRLPPIYGEFDAHFVSTIMRATREQFNNVLPRLDNVWIRHQPIYVANAAWALVCAKRAMESDQSLSGEEFHVTDDTAIGDPFDFVQPYLEARQMRVTKQSHSFIPIWLLVTLWFFLRSCLRAVDLFGLMSHDDVDDSNTARGRLRAAIEADKRDEKRQAGSDDDDEGQQQQQRKRKLGWFDYVTPQTLGFMCMSAFMNRTKAALRLHYEPIYSADESQKRALDWYKNELKI